MNLFSDALPRSPLEAHNNDKVNASQYTRIENLERQLNIELKVKQGAENMIHSITANGDVNHREFEPPLDERIEDLKHRLRVEAAVVEGAKNVIKLLQNGSKDKSDKKALSENVMYGKTDPQQQWSVHAEFTISHPRVADTEHTPQTHTEQGDNGVRMTYTYTSQANQNAWSSRSTPPPSGSTSNRSTHSDTSKSYGFQKGNLLFTSTPPRRSYNFPETSTNSNRLGVQDSGYGSDLLSPNSFGSCLLPRRPTQPYNRKCRSTCNIVLSTNVQDENRTEDKADSVHTQCGRTQSLRCQTPTLRCDRKDNFYGCGDPWCHHLHYGDDFSCTGRFSPVLETCEDCPSGQASTKASRTNTFSTTRCEHARASLPPESDNRKDACVQTFEMIDKCTSPFVKMGSFKYDARQDKKDKILKKKYGSNSRRKTEPICQRSHSPSSITPDSLENLKGTRRLVQSPKLGKIASVDNNSKEKTSPTDSKLSDASKKPRTVHIDVYCTGTEMESDASNSSTDSSENETASTPQTVFESEKVRITHQRADETQLPFNVRKSRSRSKEKKPEVKQMEESDNDDGTSTAYPSKLSSYSTIRDFSSSISSVPQSWTTYSTSSCTVPDDYDSIANTSWKDTFSDIDSLLHSRSSIAQTDSLDFVPRKFYEKNPSIDETPEIERLETPSQESLQPSDSFEYANSEDRVRIKKMEEFWKNKAHSRHWKAPHTERRYLLQQKKIQEYLEKRLSDKSLPKWASKESDSEGTDDSEKGWTFIKEGHEKGGQTKTTPRDCNSPDKSPSTIIFQQKLDMDPTLRAPFAIVPGIYTNQRAIAKKFGSIVPVVRKPGHHIGPVKNPDCLCDHCQRHFANSSYRGRTRSMGDPPAFEVQNWKNFVLYPPTASNSNKSVPSQLYTDH
ncbi:HR1 domain containing protein [Asbolus verrucosus]|uniref:HR1 domain containing protein n=1 Tax=Asbolus verrucosus TaxID=1661398 RepID=A0A482W3R8_ASBVE|nr:HR1 domain containing protein [Asbolus verrucosus]